MGAAAKEVTKSILISPFKVSNQTSKSSPHGTLSPGYAHITTHPTTSIPSPIQIEMDYLAVNMSQRGSRP